ncbi:UbiA family prenyltransferase [Brevundimonas albigilva]|uniref:UbiA family prenyltransferase n=1 Tax=Brevundimonas albigilva TaxID=1312364 RepID=UPI003D323199
MTDAQTRPVLSTAQPEDYFQLLKPRVMSLVVFTAATGLVVAPGAVNPLVAAIAVLCIAVGAGAAGALNMALEGETDALMRRTRGRPVAAGRVRKNEAMAFGVILSLFSVMLLGMNANWLAAGLLALTIVYYAGFYTLLLKRRTPQNIVIGGAAGAFPRDRLGGGDGPGAVAGVAAVRHHLPVDAAAQLGPGALFGRRLRQGRHSDDAGGARRPVHPPADPDLSLVFVPVAIAPAVVGLGGPVYLAVSVLGGLGFLGLALRLYRSRAGDEPDKVEAVGREAALYDVRAQAKPARDLFAFSILYLMALFAALLVEALSGMGA